MPGYTLPVYPYRMPPELAGGGTGDYPVIIAGGGLGGLACALELGSRGIRTIVLDDDNTVGASGLSSRGICYAKRTLEILERFGVAERVRAKGITWNEGDVYRGEQHLYRFNLQPEAGQKFPAFVNLQQFYVEQYLVEAIAGVPCIDLRWKNRVVDVHPAGDHVEVSVETPDGTYFAHCRYLVGADGAHSIVRERIGAQDAEAALFDTAWCIADVRMAPATEAVRKAYLDNPLNAGGAIWYHQMADGVWRTDWQIGHYEDPDAEATPERANLRLRQLLGPGVEFELVWVGMWRFRKRYLAQMRHGRVFFLGDACAQHSPFGARGGNRAVQDANNLGWKLALVLAGEASPALLDTYHAERHQAARECVEISSRSAIFIAPESPGQRLVRDAILDLAEQYPAARPLVNVGRLSEACAYTETALGSERDAFDAPAARPGAAAPDGKVSRDGRETYFVDCLRGRFTVAWFGAAGPEVRAGVETDTVCVAQASAPALFERYGVDDKATYVFRPDGHVLARCKGIDPAFAAAAIGSALAGGDAARAGAAAAPHGQLEMDRRYDAYAAQVDATPEPDRPQVLGSIVGLLALQAGVPTHPRES
jgi:3-(3-hydroxy-phenyl)propionate hydroxylase